jgi:hypothetical protein
MRFLCEKAEASFREQYDSVLASRLAAGTSIAVLVDAEVGALAAIVARETAPILPEAAIALVLDNPDLFLEAINVKEHDFMVSAMTVIREAVIRKLLGRIEIVVEQLHSAAAAALEVDRVLKVVNQAADFADRYADGVSPAVAVSQRNRTDRVRSSIAAFADAPTKGSFDLAMEQFSLLLGQLRPILKQPEDNDTIVAREILELSELLVDGGPVVSGAFVGVRARA